MAIIGDLAELGLSDLLYLIRLRGMAGQLVLERGHDRAVLEVRQGRPIRLTSSSVSQRLGDRLVQRGLLTPQEVSEVLARQAAGQGTVALGTLLLEHNLVARQDLEAILACQAEEIVQQLLTWPDGTFTYTRTPLPAAAVPLPELNLEQLILEALHRADELGRATGPAGNRRDSEVAEADEAWTVLQAQDLDGWDGQAGGPPSQARVRSRPISLPRMRRHLAHVLRTLTRADVTVQANLPVGGDGCS